MITAIVLAIAICLCIAGFISERFAENILRLEGLQVHESLAYETRKLLIRLLLITQMFLFFVIAAVEWLFVHVAAHMYKILQKEWKEYEKQRYPDPPPLHVINVRIDELKDSN
ncbi:hypothetical protein AB6A40_011380 [Gnathostoma spinigerum]|uniref:Uncharacterized protein n=1 Tax=Gnathostoma spinigerum TaxID=75299 RepID=A0ABD6F2V6_9BILA